MAIFLRNGDQAVYDHAQEKQLKLLYGHLPGRILLKAMTQPIVSKIGGLYMSSPLSRVQIKPFIEKNNIKMDEYVDTTYHSYNDFFTRQIKENKRKIDEETSILMAPCDSKVTHYKIDEDTKITIKNTVYSLDDLLLSPYLSDQYRGGDCLVFRLTVDDYHHYHFIDEGTCEEERIIPGVFHTVNPIANDYFPIYKTNTRHYTLLHTKHFGDVVYMEVGALMVGKIVNRPIKKFKRGEEKGYFEFGGSTVVLLFKENTIKLDQDILEHSKDNDEVKVQLGERIGVHL